MIVGGAGKTPSVICLVNQLLALGIKPAVISRGYKSKVDKNNKNSKVVRLESSESSSLEFGDEPCLIAETGVPVCVGERVSSYKLIISEFPNTDVVLLDDGLQQQRIKPDRKILVLDKRIIGNGNTLPFGPLREPIPLRHKIDSIILNCINDEIFHSDVFEKVKLPKTTKIGHLKMDSVTWRNYKNIEVETKIIHNKIQNNYKKTNAKPLAVAGIAVPSRFFELLENLKIEFEPLWFENHDINFAENLSAHLKTSSRIVLLTEKDWVRIFYSKNLSNLNSSRFWAMKLNLSIEKDFTKNVTNWI